MTELGIDSYCGYLDIFNDFSLESNIFRTLDGPLDFHSGTKNGLKSVSLVKNDHSMSMI